MTEEHSNVARYLSLMAREAPGSCAIKVPQGCNPDGIIIYNELSFSELNKGCDNISRYLSRRKVGRGNRVLLLLKPGIDFIMTSFALFKIGAVPILIDPGMRLKHFLNCLRQSEPDILIGIPKAQWLSRLFFPYLSKLRTRINSESNHFRQAKSRTRGECKGSESYKMAITHRNDLAAILFTSGSTGPPKGVCYEHGMFEAQVRLIREQYEIKRGEIDLPLLPIFALFNPALGMTTVVPEMNPSQPATINPLKIVQSIIQCEVTNSFGSPAVWSRISRHCMEYKVSLPTVKRVLMAGAPVSPSLIEEFKKTLPHGTIYTPYGATECLPISSISGPEILKETWALTRQGRGTCVGKPLPEISVRVIQIMEKPIEKWAPDLEVPRGTIGEIIVRGSVVTKEYDFQREKTRWAKIDDEGEIWHRMGDLGYIDDEERLWFCGRMAERVRTSEGDLFTDCCEAIFNQHSAVFRTALIGLGEPGEQTPAIVVEPEKDKYPDKATQRHRLIAELRELGDGHKTTRSIDRFFIQKTLPVDVRHNAKIHRLTLARRYNKKNFIYYLSS